MEADSEDVHVLGFAVWVSDLLLNHDKFLVVTVLEQDMIVLLDLKVIGWLQRVKHDVSLILIFELSAFAVAESDDCNTILWKRDKVMSCSGQESLDLWLPELEGLMSKDYGFVIKVDHVTIESVDVHSFVTQNKLSIALSIVWEDKHVCIANIEFVTHIDDELSIELLLSSGLILNYGRSFIHSDQEQPKFTSGLICEQVETASVINYTLNGRNHEFLIDINFSLCFAAQIEVDTIICWGDHEDFLVLVHPEEVWLLFEWVQECVDICNLLFLEVVFYNLPLFGKYDGICLLGNLVVFENEVHTDTLELWIVS